MENSHIIDEETGKVIDKNDLNDEMIAEECPDISLKDFA